MKRLLPLFFILVIGVLLRFPSLGHNPIGLFWDEQDTGYQAYSLLTTGKDYFGRTLPLFLHSLADWRTPVFIYSAVPFVHFFGLTALAVRLPAALSGLISVLLIYYLGRLLYNHRVGLFAALFLSVSMWAVLYNRQSVECNIMLMYLILGLVAFYKKWLPLSALSFALAIASYSTAKLFVPLLVGYLVLAHWPVIKSTNFKTLALSLFLGSLIGLPVLFQSTFGPAGTRFHDVSIFTDPTIPSSIDYKRLESDLAGGTPRTLGMQPKLLTKLVYNKFTLPFSVFVTNYFNTYSAQYLFTQGDTNPRQSPSPNSIGQLYLVEAVPLLIGLYFMVKNKNYLLVFWFLAGPIPSALTRDGGPHAARTFLLLPAFALVVGYGVYILLQKSRLLLLSYCLLLLLSSVFAYQYFFTTYRFEGAAPFQWGYDQLVTLAVSSSPHYDHVYVDTRYDSALMAYLFYTKYSPALFQSQQPFPTAQVLPDATATQFGNIYLLNPGVRVWTNTHLPGHNLIISSAAQPLIDAYTPKQTLTYPDSTPAFYIFAR